MAEITTMSWLFGKSERMCDTLRTALASFTDAPPNLNTFMTRKFAQK
jgi:hypothetical protein